MAVFLTSNELLRSVNRMEMGDKAHVLDVTYGYMNERALLPYEIRTGVTGKSVGTQQHLRRLPLHVSAVDSKLHRKLCSGSKLICVVNRNSSRQLSRTMMSLGAVFHDSYG
jgi:hypothetical protein